MRCELRVYVSVLLTPGISSGCGSCQSLGAWGIQNRVGRSRWPGGSGPGEVYAGWVDCQGPLTRRRSLFSRSGADSTSSCCVEGKSKFRTITTLLICQSSVRFPAGFKPQKTGIQPKKAPRNNNNDDDIPTMYCNVLSPDYVKLFLMSHSVKEMSEMYFDRKCCKMWAPVIIKLWRKRLFSFSGCRASGNTQGAGRALVF